jgi:hypothetical protein
VAWSRPPVTGGGEGGGDTGTGVGVGVVDDEVVVLGGGGVGGGGGVVVAGGGVLAGGATTGGRAVEIGVGGAVVGDPVVGGGFFTVTIVFAVNGPLARRLTVTLTVCRPLATVVVSHAAEHGLCGQDLRAIVSTWIWMLTIWRLALACAVTCTVPTAGEGTEMLTLAAFAGEAKIRRALGIR